jgi:carboxylesterase
VRRRLDLVRTPCLVVHSADDDIASLANVELIERRVAAPVETVLLDDSYHIVSVDRQRDLVIDRSVRFFRKLAPASDVDAAPRAPSSTAARAPHELHPTP